MKRLHMLLSLATVGFAAEAAAKPLYITVPRSFGTNEAVVVDVAFANKEPVELRILKPNDLAKFVRSQANLRRAYERPKLEINTGRYLSAGINRLRSPGHALLNAIDPELRLAVSGDLPSREKPAVGTGARLSKGPKHLVDIPADTRLVDRKWLNLELGSSEREFSVPGFSGWGAYGGGFQDRKVSLGRMPAGVYILQLVQGRVEGQVLLVVTDLSVQVKQTDGAALVRVVGRDQRPRAGAQVSVFTPAGAGPTGTTNEKGEISLETNEPRLVVLTQVEKDVAVVDTDFFSTLAISPDVFIYTDRPIYKPGHTASFRGVVRQPDSFLSRLFTPKKRRVGITVLSQDGESKKTTAKVDEYGCFSGTTKVPGKVTGVLTFVAKLDDTEYQAESRIQDYVKPTFYVEIRSDQETVRPGETLKARLRVRRYAGGAPDNTKYEFTLSRTVLETPAWVDDAGLGSEGSEVTYGSVSTTEGVLSIPKRLYSSREARGASYDSWSSAPSFDAKGEAEIEIPVPPLDGDDGEQGFKYVLSVQAKDDQDSDASKSKAFFFSPTEVLGTVLASTKVILEGGDARVAVRATTPSGKVFGVAKGRVTFELESADGSKSEIEKGEFETNFDGIWRGRFPRSGPGRLWANVELDDKQGRTWKGNASLLVAGKNGEPVARVPILTTESLGGELGLGDKAQLVALFPDRWGPGGKNEGFAWLTLQGSTIFDTKMVKFSGQTLVYEFEIEKRFGSAVYASIAYGTSTGRWEERIVPFRIVPKERALRVTIEALKQEAEPLGQQEVEIVVTDHEGRGVQAQLSVGVVDKAIYALQREFRPHVLDFFYPLVRNNVTSFFSMDFQGYGYGEMLALKRGDIAPHAFASVKPPVMEEKEDTAYWNPRVTTGRDGRATVRFSMPANQTIWTITALAADDSGRFGEATSEFATRGRLSVVTAVPQFLRAGDEVTGSVRVARGEKGKNINMLSMAWSTKGALSAKEDKPTLNLAGKTELVTPIATKADKVGTGFVNVKVDGKEVDVADRRRIPVREATVEELRTAEGFGGGELALDIPDGADIASIEVELMPTSVAVALANLRSLLSYPYGCLEQRVATTIPNIAVFRTLETAGATASLDAKSRALLSEARSRAVRGVAQILDLALPTGGFVWFNGYEKPSLELTLIALDGLAYAAEAGLVESSDPRVARSLAWLADQTVEAPELAATQAYVLARFDGKKHAALVRSRLEAGVSGNLHADALTVLAAHAAGVAGEVDVAETLAALTQASYEGLGKPVSFERAAYWRYPMRSVGLGAILGHAASKGEVDAEQLRAKMLDIMAGSLDSSTFDRSTFLLHSQWLLAHDAKKLSKIQTPEVSADSGSVGKAVPRGLGLVHALDTGARKVTVGTFDGVARVTARMRVPATDASKVAEGMSIGRRYFRVGSDGSKSPIEGPTPVKVGDEIYVELTIDGAGTEWRGRRSAYYVVRDRVPAGLVVLQEDKAFRAAPYELPLDHESLRRRTFSPEEVTMFFDEPAWWSRSPRKIGYMARAQFAGTFTVPPAEIEDMYEATVRGRSAGRTLTIGPRE